MPELSDRSRKIIAVVALVAVAFVIVKIILMPSSRTVFVRITGGELVLTKYGYAARLHLYSGKPTKIIGVFYKKSYVYSVVDVPKGKSIVDVPLPGPASEIIVDFAPGFSLKVTLEDKVGEPRLHFGIGNSYLFVFGTLPYKAPFVIVGVPEYPRVALVAPMSSYMYVKKYIANVKYAADVDPIFIPGRKPVYVSNLSSYDVIIFYNLVPSNQLLGYLYDKVVIIDTTTRSVKGVDIDVGTGALKVTEYDLRMFVGSGCLNIMSESSPVVFSDKYVNAIVKLNDLFKFKHRVGIAVYASPVCERRFSRILATTKMGDIAFAMITRKLYWTSLPLYDIVLLAVSGYFNKATIAYRVLDPFKGIRPLAGVEKGLEYIVVSYFKQYYIVERVSRNIDYSMISDTQLRVYVYSGSGPVRVTVYTYDLEPVNVYTYNATPPVTIPLEYNASYFYVVEAGNVSLGVIADESVAGIKPSIIIDTSNVYETFSATVHIILNKRLQTPLIILYNNVPVGYMFSGGDYTISKKSIGYNEIAVTDVYGRVYKRKTFKVVHIYETPIFIAVSMVGALALVGGYKVLRHRAEAEYDIAYVAFDKPTSSPIETITPKEAASYVNKVEIRKLHAPLVDEVLQEYSKRVTSLTNIVDFADAMRRALNKKLIRIASLYTPELRDTITAVGVEKDPWERVVLEAINGVASKTGVYTRSMRGFEDLKEILNADFVIMTNKWLVLGILARPVKTEADIKKIIGRVMKTLIEVHEFKLPLQFGGVAVVGDAQTVSLLNRVIDIILKQQPGTERYLPDASLQSKLSKARFEEWIGRFIIVAVPYTRLAPLLAAVRNADAYQARSPEIEPFRFVNIYYRLLFY